MEQIRFSDEELVILSQEGTLLSFLPNQPIHFEGDSANDLCIVLSGRVRVIFHAQNGEEIVLRVVEEGRIFGESAFLRHSAHPTSVFAINHVELISCSIDQLLHCLGKHPQLTKKLLQLCSVTMNHLSYLIHDIHFLNRFGRVAAFLLRETANPNPERGVTETHLPYTHEEIGWYIGMDRATVSRVLNSFRKKGLLKTAYRSIELLDREGLDRAAKEGLRSVGREE